MSHNRNKNDLRCWFEKTIYPFSKNYALFGERHAWLARLNYEYKNKYILSLSFRRDGCSRFGSNARWANFPSVSGGWVMESQGISNHYERSL